MIRRLVLAVALVPMLLLAACDWAQPGYGPDRAGYNPGESRLGPGNVGELTEAWSVPLPAGTRAAQGPVVARGRVFATADNVTDGPSVLTALDADDGTELWTRTVVGVPDLTDFGPDLRVTTAGDVVLLSRFASADFGGLEAIDAATGETLWSVTERMAFGDPIVHRGVVYAWYLSIDTFTAGVAAIDLETGETLWRSPAVALRAALTSVQGGRVYALVGEELQVYDAAGVENCAGEPTTCEPLWTAGLPTAGYRAPAVAAGSVFVVAGDGLRVFPAGGCGAATCTPSWRTTGGNGPAGAAVAKGTVFVPAAGGLGAYQAAGCGAATCAAQWTGTGASGIPAIANGVVYATGGDRLHAFASAGCGAAACAPLWSSPPGVDSAQQPAVGGGRAYTAGTSVTAFALPAG